MQYSFATKCSKNRKLYSLQYSFSSSAISYHYLYHCQSVQQHSKHMHSAFPNQTQLQLCTNKNSTNCTLLG